MISALVYLGVVWLSLMPVEDTAIVRLPDGSSITCEIADTPRERSVGLSRHQSLEPGSGMLFAYPEDRHLSFWMPHAMKFNLDIIFIDANCEVISISSDVPPCPDPQGFDCPNYSPQGSPARYVLEIIGGAAVSSGIKPGTKLEITFPENYKRPSVN